jgi:hypothetical protein
VLQNFTINAVDILVIDFYALRERSGLTQGLPVGSCYDELRSFSTFFALNFDKKLAVE